MIAVKLSELVALRLPGIPPVVGIASNLRSGLPARFETSLRTTSFQSRPVLWDWQKIASQQPEHNRLHPWPPPALVVHVND